MLKSKRLAVVPHGMGVIKVQERANLVDAVGPVGSVKAVGQAVKAEAVGQAVKVEAVKAVKAEAVKRR